MATSTPNHFRQYNSSTERERWRTLEFETLVRSNRTSHHLVHRFAEIKNLITPRSQSLNERTLLQLILLLPSSSHEENLFLSFLPSRDDVVEGGEICRGGGVESKELDESRSMFGVLYRTEFERDASFEVELVIFLWFFSREFGEEIERLSFIPVVSICFEPGRRRVRKKEKITRLTRLIKFPLIFPNARLFNRLSRPTFKGRSSASTKTLTQFNHFGKKSSPRSLVMKTRRTKS